MPDIAQLRTTLIGKTIDADDNTITDIDDDEIKAAAAIDYSKLNLADSVADSDIAASGITTRNKLPAEILYTDTSQSITGNKTFSTGVGIFRNTMLRVSNPTATQNYIFRGLEITTNRDITLPLLTGNDIVVCEANAQALTNKTFGTMTMQDGANIVLNTTTGNKIGTGTTQKLAFYNATPIVQGAAIADATDATSVITACNAIISRLEALGLIATV